MRKRLSLQDTAQAKRRGLWRNIRMKGSDLTPETDRLHVVLSKDYETAALVLCLALGPTTAGPSNISQARTMAWPSKGIDLEANLLLLKSTKHSPFSLHLQSLQPYTTQTSPTVATQTHISLYPFLLNQQQLVNPTPTINTTQSICVPLPSSSLSLLLPSPLALTASTASTTSPLLLLRRPLPTALVCFTTDSSSYLQY